MHIKKTLVLLLFLLGFSTMHAQMRENVYKLGQWDDPTIPINTSDVRYNECWGFEYGGEEYGIIGSRLGGHIIHLAEDHSMEQVAFIPGRHQSWNVVHRDFHTYKDYMYAICQQGSSSLQVADLRYLPDSVHIVYDSNTHFEVAHNIFIDSSSAILYVCGPMGNAMSLYSLADPENPTFITHFNGVDYVHDLFVRNDTAYLNAGDQGLFVYNFANPTAPIIIGSLEFYPDKGYNHSGWLSEDGNTYVFADETEGKRMKVCDVSDLTDINVLSLFNSEDRDNTIPHNLMLKGRFVYVSHYNDGLQIFDISDRENPVRAGYYDTFADTVLSNFKGAWGIYAFLPSGRILLSDRNTGLYLFHFEAPPAIESEFEHGIYPNPMQEQGYLYFDNPNGLAFDLSIYDARGRRVRGYTNITKEYLKINRLGLNQGMYFYRLQGTNNDRLMHGKFLID